MQTQGVEIGYLAEGVNFAFDRIVYRNRDEALADIKRDYANAGGFDIIDAGRMGGLILTLGNGNVIALTPLRIV